MDPSEILQLSGMLLTAIIAGSGWWYRSKTEVKADTKKITGISVDLGHLKTDMDKGFKAVYHSVDEIKENFERCRKEETVRINRLEDKVDRKL